MTKRDTRWDNIKFALIFLVVLGHMASCYLDAYSGIRCMFTYIYTFHMPAFLFISGLFAKHTVDAEKLDWHKIVPYAVLCVFLSFYRNLSLYLFDHEQNFHIKDQDNISWYLWVLFVYFAVTWFLKKYPHKNVLIISVLFALIVGYDTKFNTGWALSRIVCFYPFFYMGYLLDPTEVGHLLDSKVLKALSAFWLAAYGVILFLLIDDGAYALRKFFTGQNSYATLYGEEYKLNLTVFLTAPVFRLGVMCLTLLTMFAVMALVPKGHIPFVSNAGQRTLAVYFWHLPIVTVLTNIRPIYAFAHTSLLYCCITCVAGAILLTVLFSLKPFMIPVEWVLRPGKRKAEKQDKKDRKQLMKELAQESEEISEKLFGEEADITPIVASTVDANQFLPEEIVELKAEVESAETQRERAKASIELAKRTHSIRSGKTPEQEAAETAAALETIHKEEAERNKGKPPVDEVAVAKELANEAEESKVDVYDLLSKFDL